MQIYELMTVNMEEHIFVEAIQFGDEFASNLLSDNEIFKKITNSCISNIRLHINSGISEVICDILTFCLRVDHTSIIRHIVYSRQNARSGTRLQ